MSNYPASSFTKIFSGCVGLATISHGLDTLALLTKLLKPGGLLTFVQIISSDEDPASLTSSLVLSGLTAQAPPQPLDTFPGLGESLTKLHMSQGTAYQV